MTTRRRCICVILMMSCASMAAGDAVALNIAVNTNFGFFNSSPAAQATILKAAADVSDAITSSLTAVDRDNWQTTVSGATVGVDWHYRYTDPVTGSPVMIDPAHVPANTVSVRVLGSRLSGSTLGIGSTVATGFQVTATSNVTQTSFTTAINQLNTLSESEFRRGAGAYNRFNQILQLNVNGNLLSAGVDVDFGIAYGVVQLDEDTDNNGTNDSAATLNNFWHLDYQTPVAAGKNDLYSVVVHELLHVLGVGSSTSWNNSYNGTTWFGSEVIAEHGTGQGLINGSHIAAGIMSRSIVNGATQEAAMSASLTVGTRKYLTTLDLAFLRDLGYATITPEFGLQGDYNGDGMVDARDYTMWRNSLGSTTKLAADGNGNNVIDAGDYTFWKSRFGNTSSAALAASGLATAHVPEPSSLATVIAGGLLATLLRILRRNLSSPGDSLPKPAIGV